MKTLNNSPKEDWPMAIKKSLVSFARRQGLPNLRLCLRRVGDAFGDDKFVCVCDHNKFVFATTISLYLRPQ